MQIPRTLGCCRVAGVVGSLSWHKGMSVCSVKTKISTSHIVPWLTSFSDIKITIPSHMPHLKLVHNKIQIIPPAVNIPIISAKELPGSRRKIWAAPATGHGQRCPFTILTTEDLKFIGLNDKWEVRFECATLRIWDVCFVAIIELIFFQTGRESFHTASSIWWERICIRLLSSPPTHHTKNNQKDSCSQ